MLKLGQQWKEHPNSLRLCHWEGMEDQTPHSTSTDTTPVGRREATGYHRWRRKFKLLVDPRAVRYRKGHLTTTGGDGNQAPYWLPRTLPDLGVGRASHYYLQSREEA